MVLKDIKPKIGFIPVANRFFGLDLAETVRKEAIDALREIDAELFIPVDKVVNRVEEAVEVCRRCIEADIDLALIFFCSWSNEEVPNAIASELSGYPILLWSIPVPEELISPCGLVSAASNLTHMGKRFGYVFGAIGDKETMRRIGEYASASAVVKKLRRAKIGVVGYNCPGMIDVTFSEIDVKRLGPEVVHLSLLELMDIYNSIGVEAVAGEVDELARTVGKVVEPSREDLINAVRMYYALKRLVDQHGLDAITVRCWPELREQRGTLPCYGFSRLSDEGVMGVCESDVLGAVTQLITYWLSGVPSFNGDFGAIYPEENVIQLWHCGAAASKLAKSLRDIHIRAHAQVGVGVEMEFPLREGRVTITRITRPIDGRFKMLIATGEALPITKRLRGNPANIRLDAPLNRFLDALIKGGVEHHLIMAYGDLARELLTLCRLMDIEPIIP